MRCQTRLLLFLLAAPLAGPLGCSTGGGSGGLGGAGGSGGADLLVVRPNPGWSTQAQSQTFEMRRLDLKTGQETISKGSVSPENNLTFSNLIAIREAVAAFAAEHKLTERMPTAAESKAGWTEVYSRADGAAIWVRENATGLQLEISVREGNKPRLRPLLVDRLGLNPPPPVPKPAPPQRKPRAN